MTEQEFLTQWHALWPVTIMPASGQPEEQCEEETQGLQGVRRAHEEAGQGAASGSETARAEAQT